VAGRIRSLRHQQGREREQSQRRKLKFHGDTIAENKVVLSRTK
jgi:hypothetical protein